MKDTHKTKGSKRTYNKERTGNKRNIIISFAYKF